ncbi:hypothetical protein M758_2G093300 [Ceratodon purpureus]|nr:hypothetical protein M758_2G093300 [Ceratodon purpureus]
MPQVVEMVAKSRVWMLAGGYHIILFMSVLLSVCQEAALAQGSDAGKVYLDQKEWHVKWIAGNASLNDANCGSLDGCKAANCSRVRCYPVSGGAPLQCAPAENQFYGMCTSGGCKDQIQVDYSRSYVNLPAPASTKLSAEVARDICLQRMLDSTFQTLSVPSNYSEFFFGSTSGAFRQFPGREQNETQCTSYEPRLRPWYLNDVSVSKDVKILVDVARSMEQPVTVDYNRPPSSSYLDVAKNITLGLLNAFSPQDYVEVISFDSVTVSSLGGSFLVNSSYDYFNPSGHFELAALVTNVNNLVASSVPTALSNLNGAILKAASSFNQLISLKVIIVLSNGLFVVNSTTFPSIALHSNKAKLMVYKLPTNDDGGDTFLLKTSFQKDICSVQGSFESLDALATANPLYSMRSYFTYLARIQLSAVGDNVTWSNTYPSVSQNQTSLSPTYPAFGKDGLLIGVVGSDVVINKLDEPLRTLVLQDFSRRNRGTLQAPANISMTCYYQTTRANEVCTTSTPPSSSAICPRNNDTSSTLAERTCCGTCGPPSGFNGKSGLAAGAIAGISIAAMVAVVNVVVCTICAIRWWRRRRRPPHPPYPGGNANILAFPGDY